MAWKSDRLLKSLIDLLEALDKRGKVEIKRRGDLMGAEVEYRYSIGYLLPNAEAKLNSIPAEDGESLVDVFDRGDYISLVALIPNVKEEDLRFKIDRDAIRLTVNADGNRVERELSFQKSSEVDEVLGASFKNGVLEIKLRKKQSLEYRK